MLAYGDNIFMNASQQTVVQGFNYVPKGVDKEITNRLGFQLIGTGMLVPGTEKNCANGICAGICAVWIAAFISRNASAINHSNFNSYFKHYLRF